MPSAKMNPKVFEFSTRLAIYVVIFVAYMYTHTGVYTHTSV